MKNENHKVALHKSELLPFLAASMLGTNVIINNMNSFYSYHCRYELLVLFLMGFDAVIIKN